MVSFPDAIKLGFQGYVKFSGRSTRAEFWWWCLFYFIVGAVAGIINSFIFGEVNILGSLVGLAFLLPNIAVSVRRLHDINKTGLWLLWWLLMYLVSVIITIIGLFLAFTGVMDGNWDTTGSWVVLILGVGLFIIVSLGILIWWIIWFVQPGDLGPNKYGPHPREDSEVSVSYSSEASSVGEAVVEKSIDDSFSDGMNCPACYADNKPDSKFCKKCGEKF